MEMTCPKCRGAMRAYERNGVTVDQCGECRGIFLDRGELERLIDAEASYNAAAPAAAPAPAPAAPIYGSPSTHGSRPVEAGYPAPPAYDPRHDSRRYDSDRPRYDSDRPRYDAGRARYDSDRPRYADGAYRPKRKRSFLEDLFD